MVRIELCSTRTIGRSACKGIVRVGSDEQAAVVVELLVCSGECKGDEGVQSVCMGGYVETVEKRCVGWGRGCFRLRR